MGYAELLNSLSLQPSAPVAEIGVPITFSILPDLSGVKVTEVQMVDVEFDFIAKGFVFQNDDLDDATVTGTLPIQDLVSNPPAVTPGVPGYLGKLRGQMPVPVSSDVAPRLEVTWAVRDGMGRDAIARGDAVATGGPGGTSLTVQFLPDVIELLNLDDPGTTPRQVSATVTMYAGSTSVGSRTLGPVTIQARRLAMPTILTMFVDKNYTGMMLVVVMRETAIFNIGHLTGHVHELYNLLSPFGTNPRLGFVVAALGHLGSALNTQPHIQFRKTDAITNLNDITLETDWFNTEAEDEMSSLLLVGPPRRKAEFFNDRSFKVFQGVITLRTDVQLAGGVRDLHSDWPSAEPLGAVLIRQLESSSDTFGDKISSVRFLELPE
jgi:hypothetical protein